MHFRPDAAAAAAAILITLALADATMVAAARPDWLHREASESDWADVKRTVSRPAQLHEKMCQLY